MQSPVRLPSGQTSLVSCGPGGRVWSAALDRSSHGRRCGELVRSQLHTTRRQMAWNVGLCHAFFEHSNRSLPCFLQAFTDRRSSRRVSNLSPRSLSELISMTRGGRTHCWTTGGITCRGNDPNTALGACAGIADMNSRSISRSCCRRSASRRASLSSHSPSNLSQMTIGAAGAAGAAGVGETDVVALSIELVNHWRLQQLQL
jgi:hypothetical protein